MRCGPSSAPSRQRVSLGHVVQIADPAEETLPYDGRIEFLGMGSPLKYLAKKTEALREDYVAAYRAHATVSGNWHGLKAGLHASPHRRDPCLRTVAIAHAHQRGRTPSRWPGERMTAFLQALGFGTPLALYGLLALP